MSSFDLFDRNVPRPAGAGQAGSKGRVRTETPLPGLPALRALSFALVGWDRGVRRLMSGGQEDKCFQIPKFKQIPNANPRRPNLFCFESRIWVTGIYVLFGAWNLALIASLSSSSLKSRSTNSPFFSPNRSR